MCGLGTWELLIVLAIVVLLFGAARLPQLGKALGETVRNFKKGQSGPQPVQEPKKGAEDRAAAQLKQGEPGARIEEAEIEAPAADSSGDKSA